MKIICNRGAEYKFCWSNSLGNILEKKSEKGDNLCLLFGLKTLSLQESYFNTLKKNYSKLLFLDHAQSSIFFDANFSTYLKNIKLLFHIFTINKHTVKVYKNFYDIKNISYIKLGFPLSEEKYHKYSKLSILDKKIDIIYSGGVYSKDIFEVLKIMKNYNYIFTSFYKQRFFGKFTANPFFYIKQQKFYDHNKMLKLQSQSKLAICHFVHFLNEKKDKEEIEKYNFSYSIPELKGRMFELAATKTLMIVKKDQWNIIEEYFKPNEDFVYFETFKDLKEKVSEIICNYENYWPLVESAYSKILYNTPEKMLLNIKKKLLSIK